MDKLHSNFFDRLGLGVTVISPPTDLPIVTVFLKRNPDIYSSDNLPLKGEKLSDKIYDRLILGTMIDLANQTLEKEKGEISNGRS